jgi:predicted nucleic-acid-binding protein
MKSRLIAFFVLVGTTICFAQTDTTKVSFVSYWSKGDSYDFKVTKIKRQWKGESLTKNDTSSYIANFLVVDSTAKSYTIKWSFKTNLKEFNIPKELIGKFSKYQVTEVIYKTNELGQFLGIENWEEIGKMVKEMLNELVDALSKDKKADKEAIKSALAPVMNIYSSQQGIEQLVFSELRHFHFPFGVEYSVNEPIAYEDEVPNMAGGNPIRGDSKIYFEEVSFKDSWCVLIQEMRLNKEDTKEVINSLFKQMNLKNEEMSKAMAAAQFDIQDYNRYEYYYYPGIPSKIETKRESLVDIANEKGKRVDITRIELMD